MVKYLSGAFVLITFCSCINHLKNDDSKNQTEAIPTISVRNAHSMVYHSLDSRLYLFGGANEQEVLSDLWILEGDHWQKMPTKIEPTSRTFASMIYDRAGDRILLFGGSRVLFGSEPSTQNMLNDTWEFKNGSWKKIATENSPIPRAEASMVYDEYRQRVVLFGGYTIQNNEYIKLGDTWEFYENNWHLASKEGPSARHGASMTYVHENNFSVLFGGSTVDKQYGESQGETWIWNGEKWNKLDINNLQVFLTLRWFIIPNKNNSYSSEVGMANLE